MQYTIQIWPPHEREQIIKRQSETPLRKFQTYDVFEGTPTELPVIRIPLALPVYRLSNGRTQTEQLAVITRDGLPHDYFSSGEENETVQQKQHKILWDFAQQGTTSITPIAAVLEDEAQREPIMITPRGIVVNGNRRLAAMRELYAKSSADFAHYESVECAVLPHLTPDQIVEIEVRLQMRPETKLDYDWIDECLMVQRLVTHNKDEGRVAKLMRIRPKDVKAALAALNEANIYLADWLKAPKDYTRVRDHEQFFYDLPKKLQGKSGEFLEASRRVAWFLIQNSDALGQRVYAFNATFGDQAEATLKRISTRLAIPLTRKPSSSAAEVLDFDIGDELETSYAPLIAELDNVTRRDEVRDEVISVCKDILASNKTEDVGRSALLRLREANSRLAEIDLTTAAPSTYGAIEKQLNEIVNSANSILAKLQLYQRGKKS